MSWNFLRKPVSSKLYQPQDLDQATINANLALSVQLTEFNAAETCLKSLYTSIKKIQDNILCTGKLETKLTTDLVNAKLYIERDDDQDDSREMTMDEAIETWRTIALSSYSLNENYVISLQRYVIDPMKRLKQAFTDLRLAIRAHEVTQNNLNKWQRKVSKYGDKRRTGNNLVRVEEAKRQLSLAQGEFSRSSQRLLEDLSHFLSGSPELRRPLVEAFAEAEVAFMEANRRIVKSQMRNESRLASMKGRSKFASSASFSSRHSLVQSNDCFRKLDQLSICSGSYK